MDNKSIAMIHQGSLGDCVYSLPTVRSFCEQHNTTADFYLQVGVKENLPNGTFRPTDGVMLNETMADKLIPLLKKQNYIRKATIWSDEPIDLNLNKFRSLDFDFGKGDIARWYAYALPQANPDFARPWLHVNYTNKYSDMIVVARSLRYQNRNISYGFLNNYDKVAFVGLPKEYRAFRTQVLNAEYVEVNDFYELAQVINSSKLFIGNQTFAFSLAQGLDVRRCLEVYPQAPNVVIHTIQGRDAINQVGLETIVKLSLQD